MSVDLDVTGGGEVASVRNFFLNMNKQIAKGPAYPRIESLKSKNDYGKLKS